MPNLTIALTKDTSAYRCYVPKSHDGYGGPGNDRQYSSCISPCSYAFCLGAIEETYNKDQGSPSCHLSNKKTKTPFRSMCCPYCEGRTDYLVCLCGSKIATDRCPQPGPAGRCLRLVTYLCFFLQSRKLTIKIPLL